MSYSTKTKMIVLFTLIVSFGFMGYQPAVTPIAPDPSSITLPNPINHEAGQVNIIWNSTNPTINYINGGNTTLLIDISTILASSDWNYTGKVYVVGNQSSNVVFIQIIDSHSYIRYVEVIDDGFILPAGSGSNAGNITFQLVTDKTASFVDLSSRGGTTLF